MLHKKFGYRDVRLLRVLGVQVIPRRPKALNSGEK